MPTQKKREYEEIELDEEDEEILDRIWDEQPASVPKPPSANAARDPKSIKRASDGRFGDTAGQHGTTAAPTPPSKTASAEPAAAAPKPPSAGADTSAPTEKKPSKSVGIRSASTTWEGVERASARKLDKDGIHEALNFKDDIQIVRGENRPNSGLPAGTRPEVTDLQRGAMQKYSYFNDRPMNAILRGNATEDGSGGYTYKADGKEVSSTYGKEFYSEMKKQLDGAFAAAPVLAKPVKVLRGMTIDPEGIDKFIKGMEHGVATGEPITLNGYTSTASPDGLLTKIGFGKKLPSAFKGNVTMKINAVHGLDMKPHSQLASESEFLLDHGSQFSVNKVTKDKLGNYTIEMDQHPPKRGKKE